MLRVERCGNECERLCGDALREARLLTGIYSWLGMQEVNGLS